MQATPFVSVISVYRIGYALFESIFRKKGYILFVTSIRDIEKALRPKTRTDPATVLPKEYYDFLNVFSQELADILPPYRPYNHKIDIEPGKTPSYGPLYRMLREELFVLEKTLKDQLDKGFIRASTSSASCPVLFVRKPGEGLRFCVDYRELNAITVKNRYPIPLIREILNRLIRAKYFTKFDIIAAFNKLRITAGDK